MLNINNNYNNVQFNLYEKIKIDSAARQKIYFFIVYFSKITFIFSVKDALFTATTYKPELTSFD
jgi:hypothetical protein